MGKEFNLIMDHKAIESYHTKEDFGSTRLSRWYRRLDVFTFVSKYRPVRK